jgi:hypothetical protein
MDKDRVSSSVRIFPDISSSFSLREDKQLEDLFIKCRDMEVLSVAQHGSQLKMMVVRYFSKYYLLFFGWKAFIFC